MPPSTARKAHRSLSLLTMAIVWSSWKILSSFVAQPAQVARIGDNGTSSPCLVYILDASRDISAAAGVPACNIDDPEVWPHNENGKGMQTMFRTPHEHGQHAGQYWLNLYLKNKTDLLTDDISSACMVWVDMYCYNQWLHSYLVREESERKQHPGKHIYKLLDTITATPGFKKHHGRDYVFHMPHPGTISTYGDHLCGALLPSYTLVPEIGYICYKNPEKLQQQEAQLLPYNAVANVDLSEPVAGSYRPIFLYARSGCSNSSSASSGQLLRHYIVQTLIGTGPDVRVSCSCGHCTEAQPHKILQEELRHALFCLIIPGDTASSSRLTEAIIAGCIPVFLGPPWHTMPLGDDVMYSSIGIFLNITDTSLWIITDSTEWGNSPGALKHTYQTANVSSVTTNVPDLHAAYQYLRKLPQSRILALQTALDKERAKFYYPPWPGEQSSALAEIVFANIQRHGTLLLTT